MIFIQKGMYFFEGMRYGREGKGLCECFGKLLKYKNGVVRNQLTDVGNEWCVFVGVTTNVGTLLTTYCSPIVSLHKPVAEFADPVWELKPALKWGLWDNSQRWVFLALSN
jgi:hypothetical protein